MVSTPNHTESICYSNEDGTETGYFEGADCGKQFLEWAVDNSIIIFHNLRYDLNFLAKHFDTVPTIIARDNTFMLWQGTYHGKKITLKDSYSLISKPLRDFTKMFHLDTGAKEKMPYNYVSFDRYMSGVGDVAGCGEHESTPWVQKDYDEFNESLKAADAALPDNHWDVKKYVRFYCDQDVRILREGFNTFRKMVELDLHLDILSIYSTSSLAYEVLMNNVLLKNSRIYATSGLPDAFIRETLVGGRCMVRDNDAYHVKVPLLDVDAVSLYPSAMSTMKVPLGMPKPFVGAIPPDADYYFVDVLLKKVNKHRHFSLGRIEENGKNIWADDDRALNHIYHLDKQSLEDWIEFIEPEYEVVRGVSYNEGTTDALSEFMKGLAAKRQQLKKDGNPLKKCTS